MCVSKGAPGKPAYGPCNEQHNIGDVIAAMNIVATLAPMLSLLKSTLELEMKEVTACV